MGPPRPHETGHFYFAQTGHSHFAATFVANSLCRGPEKRTLHKPDVQVGNSGPPLDEEKSNMKMLRAYTTLFAATVVSMGVGSLAAPCLAQDANTGKGTSFADTKQVIGLEGLKHNVKGTLVA